MIRLTNRARWAGAGATAVAAALLALGACTNFKDQLLEPQNPGLIDPTAVNSPAAATALKVGALGRVRFVVDCGGNNECLWEEAGSLADEFQNSDFQNVRQDIDQRTIDDGNPEVPWVSVTQNRGFVRDAIDKVKEFLPDNKADIGELYLGLGFLEMSLAENYCNGIPLGHTIAGVVTYGPGLPDAQVLDSAATHLDSALAFASGSDDDSKFIREAALTIKARILVDQWKFAAAAALVPTSAVPSNFNYFFSTSPSSTDDDLGIWVINNSTTRLTVSDSSEVVNGVRTVTKNALPFVSANDPRVPVKNGKLLSPPIGAEDGSTPLFAQLIYGRDDPIAMASGIDARLIEAEAKLNANDIAGMMTILNGLRAAPPAISNLQPAAMPALATPASQNAAVSLFFREKAFWTFARGQRLNDLRRLMRQYKRTEDQVFPTGSYFKGGTYGHSIQLPVPNGEKPNPNFTGCIDRNP
jgi:starch-binding outer membrane protein, SusD/RagB family